MAGVVVHAYVSVEGSRANYTLSFGRDPTVLEVIPVANETFGKRYGRVSLYDTQSHTWEVLSLYDPRGIPSGSQLMLEDIAWCAYQALGAKPSSLFDFLDLAVRLRIPLCEESMKRVFVKSTCGTDTMSLAGLYRMTRTYPALSDCAMRCMLQAPVPDHASRQAPEDTEGLARLHAEAQRTRSVREALEEGYTARCQRVRDLERRLKQLAERHEVAKADVEEARGTVAVAQEEVALRQVALDKADVLHSRAIDDRVAAEARFVQCQMDMCNCLKRQEALENEAMSRQGSVSLTSYVSAVSGTQGRTPTVSATDAVSDRPSGCESPADCPSDCAPREKRALASRCVNTSYRLLTPCSDMLCTPHMQCTPPDMYEAPFILPLVDLEGNN
eukprot:TRINITY_DN4436_c2_g1_i2.p1 TRINITY_DN4436_c2_g1~~TRINITY_DN4436_c2_g1_i2.p1  ORF type:complete len:406 (+),score=108.63 TRINITY_DN4436_c2_g1_i2:59-1219(+)